MTIRKETDFPFPYIVTMHPERHHQCAKAHAAIELSSAFTKYADASDFAFEYVQRHGGEAVVLQTCAIFEDEAQS